MTAGSERRPGPEGWQDPIGVERRDMQRQDHPRPVERSATAGVGDESRRQPRPEVRRSTVDCGRPVRKQRGRRQERVRDRSVRPIEEDRAHLAKDDLVRGQVAVVDAVGDATRGKCMTRVDQLRDPRTEISGLLGRQPIGMPGRKQLVVAHQARQCAG